MTALGLNCLFWWTGFGFMFISGALAAETVFSSWGDFLWFSVGFLILEGETLSLSEQNRAASLQL